MFSDEHTGAQQYAQIQPASPRNSQGFCIYLLHSERGISRLESGNLLHKCDTID